MTVHSRLATRIGLIVVSLFAAHHVMAATAAEHSPALVRSASPDWPQWRGPQRDGISDETGLLPSWPDAGPTCLWKATGIANGYSSPIVVGDTVYVTGDKGDDLVIRAFALDGSPRWTAINGKAWNGSFPGARASCAYDDGKLYHMNAHGRLACLDAATGRELWAVDVLDRFEAQNIMWGITESVLVHDGLVFATPAGAKGLMVALDKRTGDTVWATGPLAEEQASYASPILLAVGQRRLLVNSATKRAFAVDAKDGQLCWQMPQADPKNTVTTTPILAGNRLVFTNSSRNYGAVFCVAFDGLPGDKAWSTELSVSHGGLVCVDNRLCGASSRGVAKGWLAIDAAAGTPKSVGELPPGSIVHADNRFYCLAENGVMTLQQLTGEGFKTVGSFRLAEGKDAWAHPVICKGRLFLRYHDTLFCYDVRQAAPAKP